MVFLDYQRIIVAAVCAAPLVAGYLLFKFVYSTHTWVVISTRVIAVLLGIGGVCLLALFSFMNFYFTSTTYSSAIYSPDHRRAVRVENWDAGALGGATSVILYSYSGLIQKTIFSGEYAQTDKDAVRWQSNSAISVDYDRREGTPAPFCTGKANVSVTCNPVTFTYPRTISN